MIVHIFGASGSGTTTLGKALAAALGLHHMDTDDYFWLPTDPPYTTPRPKAERLALIRSETAAHDRVVLTGSLTGWGDALIPAFSLAVRLVTDTETRLARIRVRERAKLGDRILPGGDMHDAHVAFLKWAAEYDTGSADMRSKACHDLWEQQLSCPLLTLNGAAPLDENAALVARTLAEHGL